MNKIIIFFLIIFGIAMAPFSEREFDQLFKQKNYETINDFYLKNSENSIFKKDPFLNLKIAYSLMRMKKYKESNKLLNLTVRLFYLKDHQEIVIKEKNNESIDSDSVPQNLKTIYWYIFKNESSIVLQNDHEENIISLKKKSKMEFTKRILDFIEFKENETEKISDYISRHLQSKANKKYLFFKYLTIDYLSWQTKGNLLIGGDQNKLLITNSGICLGGRISKENLFYSFFLDNCVAIAKGVVQGKNVSPVYQQSNINATGFKISPGAGFKMPSGKTEIGLKIPIFFSNQTLSSPDQSDPACSSGCKIEQPQKINILTTAYGKWNMDSLSLLTEFGKPIDQDFFYWSIGLSFKL